MTRDQSRARRRDIAQVVADGASVREAAAQFGVSGRTVAHALREFGVADQRNRNGGVERFTAYDVIAALFDGARGIHRIARDLGISHQRVAEVYRRCVRAGIPVPRRPKGQM